MVLDASRRLGISTYPLAKTAQASRWQTAPTRYPTKFNQCFDAAVQIVLSLRSSRCWQCRPPIIDHPRRVVSAIDIEPARASPRPRPSRHSGISCLREKRRLDRPWTRTPAAASTGCCLAAERVCRPSNSHSAVFFCMTSRAGSHRDRTSTRSRTRSNVDFGPSDELVS